MEAILADLRHALHGLRRSPGFALAAIGILTLGIAANTAVFSVADAVCSGLSPTIALSNSSPSPK